MTSGAVLNPFTNNVSSLPDPTGERRAVLPSARRDSNTPPPPSTQQRVSVDEMLTQLRNPEGSRRRRRSEQPIYKQRRRRRLWIGIVAGVGVLVVGGLYGFRIFQRYRLEGEQFRNSLNRRISAELKSDVTFTRIHDGGAGSLAAREVEIATYGNDLIESARLQDVSASLTSRSWISNEWGITSLNIGSGTLVLNPARRPREAEMTVPPPMEAADESRLTISPEPRLITLDAVRVVTGLNVEWPDSAGGKTPESIRNLVGGPKVRTGGLLDGSFVNGELNLRGLPPLKLSQLTWKLNGRRLEIPGGRLTSGPGVDMEIRGEADLVPDGGVKLAVSIVETQLSALFPKGWSEHISGTLDTKDCVFQSTFGKGPERTFSGDFSIKGALFSNMGFLNKLVHFLQRQDMTVLEFPSLKGHFSWSPSSGLVLTNLSAEKPGFLRLSGDVTVSSSGELQGKLRLAVANIKLEERSTKVEHPFRPDGDEWSAMDFTVSGTSASISDNIRVNVTGMGFAPPVEQGAKKPVDESVPAIVPSRSAPDKAEAERQFREFTKPQN